MSEQLPETGEGVNGEQLSPLPNTPADIPQHISESLTYSMPIHADMLGNEYDQERTTAFLDAQLPGKSPPQTSVAGGKRREQ